MATERQCEEFEELAQAARLPPRWRRLQECFPLRGRWLLLAIAGVAALVTLADAHARRAGLSFRIYVVGSPEQLVLWHEAPGTGFDCQHRMLTTGTGVVGRSFRLGDLVFEVTEGTSWFSGPARLYGPDCH
jgi:hypothetical protein